MSRHRPPPSFPIRLVLIDLGADDVPDVVGSRYVKLKCPFHFPDRNPSARVNELGFTCHACGRHGDAIKLAREELGLSYADAVEYCSRVTGITDREVPAAGWAGGILPGFAGD